MRIGRFIWQVDDSDLLLTIGDLRFNREYRNDWDPIRLRPADLQDLLVVVDASARVIPMERVQNTLRRDIHVGARNLVHEILLKTGRTAEVTVTLDPDMFMACVVDDREYTQRRIELDREIDIRFDLVGRRR